MRTDLVWAVVLSLATLSACGDAEAPAAPAECGGARATVGQQGEACVLASAQACPAGWVEAGHSAGFLVCGQPGESLDPGALEAVVGQACEGGTPASTADGRPVCLFADDEKADGPCPELVSTAHAFDGVIVCASEPLDEADLGEAVAAGCDGGTSLSVGGASGCVFITETGFSCPSFLPASQSLGSWTVCGATGLDALGARDYGQALCGLGGDDLATLVVSSSDAGCAVAITETGFDCPPTLSAAFDDGQLGICGAAPVPQPAADALFADLCGPEDQFVRADVGGACTVFITETGFQPCPALLPFQTDAEPFGTCSAAPLGIDGATRLRREVCGEGALGDFGDDTVCAYAITETGFLCPSLLPSAYAKGSATVCGRTPELAEPVVDQAAQFAEAPHVCGWVQGMDTAFSQRVGGADPTPYGLVATGSVDALEPVAITVPEDGGLTAPGPGDSLYISRINLNGGARHAQVIATSVQTVSACGQVTHADGDVTILGTAAGVVDFDAGGGTSQEDMKGSGWFAARLDRDGVLKWTVSGPMATDTPWFEECVAAGHADGSVSFVHRDASGALPGFGAQLVRITPDGEVAWSLAVPTKTQGVAGHPSGAVTIVGGLSGSYELTDTGGAKTVLSGDAGEDGWLVRLDPAGAVQRAATLGGPETDRLRDAVALGEDVWVTGFVMGEATWRDPSGAAIGVVEDDGGTTWAETIVLRVDPEGAVGTTIRAVGTGNNEGAALAVGLDGRTVHLAGAAAADLTFAGASEPIGIGVDSTLFFYGYYVATFDLETGAASSAVVIGDVDTYVNKWTLVGHLDGSTTVAATVLGVGDYGADADARKTIGKATGESVVLVHTPAPECVP